MSQSHKVVMDSKEWGIEEGNKVIDGPRAYELMDRIEEQEQKIRNWSKEEHEIEKARFGLLRYGCPEMRPPALLGGFAELKSSFDFGGGSYITPLGPRDLN